jgi:hypothetical protein
MCLPRENSTVAYSDTATTGSDGRFQFGVVEERRLFRPDLLSANPNVSQLLSVRFDGHQYLIWTFMKLDFQLGTESVNGNLKLDCDLSKFQEGASARIVQCQSNGVVRKYE